MQKKEGGWGALAVRNPSEGEEEQPVLLDDRQSGQRRSQEDHGTVTIRLLARAIIAGEQ
jgi:hypothetical protein